MSINSVNSTSNYVSQVQPQPQSYAERVAEKGISHDDSSKVAAVSDIPQSTVNTSGQKVGTTINVKA